MTGSALPSNRLRVTLVAILACVALAAVVFVLG